MGKKRSGKKITEENEHFISLGFKVKKENKYMKEKRREVVYYLKSCITLSFQIFQKWKEKLNKLNEIIFQNISSLSSKNSGVRFIKIKY